MCKNRRPIPHHGMSPPRRGGVRNRLPPVLHFFHLRESIAQDAWASADALNTVSEGLQPPLQNISCTALNACKMHQICHSAHGLGCVSLNARQSESM